MAKTSGRRTAADIAAAVYRQAIEPVRGLSEFEKAEWDRVIGAWPADHFIQSDSAMLTMYCAACEAYEAARLNADINGMGQAGRLVATFATKLRITCQSRYLTQTAGRRAQSGRSNAAASRSLLGGLAVEPEDSAIN